MLRHEKIKTIKPVGKAKVYNLKNDRHHTFIVDGGFILHNCDAFRYFVSTAIRPRRIANV